MHNLNWKLEDDVARIGYTLYCYYDDGKERVFLVNGGQTEWRVLEGTTLPDKQSIQFAFIKDPSALLEALIKGGVREPAKDYTVGKLEATEAHLKDMRKLVFKGGKK